jgi:hypothetical protein
MIVGTLRERIASQREAVEALLLEARLAVQDAQIRVEQARADLVEAESLGRRLARAAANARRPRHLMPAEREAARARLSIVAADRPLDEFDEPDELDADTLDDARAAP